VIRLVAVAVVVVIALALFEVVAPWARRRATQAGIGAPRPARSGGHEWDRRRDQVYRSLKGVGGPEEPREEIIAFLDTHVGVEAYVEPKTVMHPLSVVLVDGVGQAKRFELREDAILRELAKRRHLPVFDATIVGYPSRMRRHHPDPDRPNH
jgi:hypothetical protein